MEAQKLKRKAVEIESLENEIQEIKSFMRILADEDLVNDRIRTTSAKLKKETSISFIGLKFNAQIVQVKIPEKIRIGVEIECKNWIKELERRIEATLKN